MRTTAQPGTIARGLTLLELLLVMGLMALLFGVGIGMFTSLDLQSRTAAAEVQTVLRSANNWAAARSGPARVRIDRERGALRAEGMAVIGTWHFESLPVRGAFDLDGSAYGCVLDEDGFQGRAVAVGGRGAHVEIPVEDDAAFDLTHGFTIECALRPSGGGAGRVVAIGSACGLDAMGAGRLRGWFVAVRKDESGAKKETGRVLIESEPGVLPLGRWSRVALRYDRHRFELLVENVPVASVLETAAVWKIEGPLVLSNERRPFAGSLDSLVVSAVVTEDEVLLPPGVMFEKGVPEEVAFAPGGGLDRSVHLQAVELALVFDDGRRRSIGVSLYGTVE